MNIYSIIPFIGLGLGVILIAWMITLELRLKRLLAGKSGATLEDTILALLKNAEDVRKRLILSESQMNDLNARVKKSINGVELIRFNPFKDAGSNQSFAVAFSDENGNGVVFSSLYSREKVSVFAKGFKQGVSEQELTAEDKEVITRARGASGQEKK